MRLGAQYIGEDRFNALILMYKLDIESIIDKYAKKNAIAQPTGIMPNISYTHFLIFQ